MDDLKYMYIDLCNVIDYEWSIILVILQIGAPEHNSVESSEVASSTKSVSGHSPIPNQDARAHNHSNR